MKSRFLLSLSLIGMSMFTYAQSVSLSYKGVELEDEQELTVTDYEVDEYGEVQMAFHVDVEVNKKTTLTMTKDDSEALEGSSNDMCLVSCTSADEIKHQLLVGDTPYCYAHYYPDEAVGTSRIAYTFKTSVKSESPMTVYVNYVYNGTETGIGKASVKEEASVVLVPGSNCFKVEYAAGEAYRVSVYSLSGTMLQEFSVQGNESVQTVQLPKGCYLIMLRDSKGIIVTKKGVIG